MTTPVRIQLSRKKGFDLQAVSQALNGLPAVNCARPGRWGNDYRIGDEVILPNGHKRTKPRTREEAVYLFEKRQCAGTTFMNEALQELRGKNLACWCGPGELCHVDVLLRLVNAKPKAVK